MNIKKDIMQNVEYNRPYFDLGDLSGPEGNPIEVFRRVSEKLKELGFKKESMYVQAKLRTLKYSEQFDFINKFLDISKSSDCYEDDDYIYIKKLKIVNNIKYNIGKSDVNCYKRNYIHYNNDIDVLKAEKNDVDWFCIDVFGGTYLHTQSNLKCFNYILEKMIDEDIELAKYVFFNNNYFEENAFKYMLMFFENKFNKKKKNNSFYFSSLCDSLMTSEYKDLGYSVKLLSLLNKDKSIELHKKVKECLDINKVVNKEEIENEMLKGFLDDKKNIKNKIQKV